MTKDNVITFENKEQAPSVITDTLTEIARTGAKQMLTFALEAEVASFIAHI